MVVGVFRADQKSKNKKQENVVEPTPVVSVKEDPKPSVAEPEQPPTVPEPIATRM